MRRTLTMVGFVTLFLAPLHGGLRAQTALSAERTAAVIEALTAAIEDGYAFRDRVEEVVDHLERGLREGRYGGALDEAHLARLLTDDLRELTEDLHFGVRHDPERADRLKAWLGGRSPLAARFGRDATERFDPGSPEARALDRRYRATNYELRRLEVLEGNVGVLELGSMPPLELARPTVDAAMAFLGGVDAMILDLRGSPGGVGGFVPYLASWFLPEGNTLLYTREFGAVDTVIPFRAVDVPGPRLDEVPVYVLTSGLTGSAAENLAYTLQQHGRAVVVGESTAGAAHSATTYPLVAGFVATVPIARVVHPRTGDNWQGEGVIPDVPIAAVDAETRAHARAIETLIETADPERRRALETVARRLVAEAEATRRARPDPAAWEEYVGRYGAREVFVESGALRYRRNGQPAIPLERVGDDRFRFALPPGMGAPAPLPDVRFERDADGRVVALSLVREDGSVEAREDRADRDR